MRFYQQQHPYYCGIDLHARTMYVCVVDDNGLTREHVNLPCDPGRFLKVIEPYRERLAGWPRLLCNLGLAEANSRTSCLF